MDSHNRFDTKVTYSLARAEWLGGLAVVSVLGIMHIHDIRWPVFAGFFLVIDVIGYIPGAIAYHRSSDKMISKGYYVAYNVMHSIVTAGIMAAAWAYFVKPEWALLALPIHLFGDRSLVGGTLKPFGVPFEPATLPQFSAFERAYREQARPARAGSTPRHSALETTSNS